MRDYALYLVKPDAVNLSVGECVHEFHRAMQMSCGRDYTKPPKIYNIEHNDDEEFAVVACVPGCRAAYKYLLKISVKNVTNNFEGSDSVREWLDVMGKKKGDGLLPFEREEIQRCLNSLERL